MSKTLKPMRDFVAAHLTLLSNELLFWRKHGQLPSPVVATCFYKAAELLPGDDDAIKTVEHEVLIQSLEHTASCATLLRGN